ncbi:hypothetical protein ORS3428_23005 [Mesorhizobium sp. ORS 3428]|nr:hypothetical protein ORS3428_23005 [Mesorhizobium sp. ORS 3428]
MATRISIATRSELVEAMIERYRSSCRADKQRVLDEFVAVTRLSPITQSRRPIGDMPFAVAPRFERRWWCYGRLPAVSALNN